MSRKVENIDFFSNWYIAISYFKWFPDLFLDMMKPKTGGITLHTDQRVFMRAVVRFVSNYGVFPRSYAKTFLEIACSFICCIFFPNLALVFTAQTKENAAAMLYDKYLDLITKYPFFENEIEGVNKTQQECIVRFKSGSYIYTLANAQSSKGRRGARETVEEAGQLKAELFDDVLKPIVDSARPLSGDVNIVDPMELNHQINFFTTSWYRASYEYQRNLIMLKSMANLEGQFVFGGDWRLPCWYGRGLDKKGVFDTKKKVTKVSFDMNYNSKWVGATDGALVDANALINSQVIKEAEFESDGVSEYYVGVDVARSDNDANCQTSISVGKVKRKKNNRIDKIELIYLKTVSGTLNFSKQAIEVKKVRQNFNSSIVIVDSNGVGKGLTDELLKEQEDIDENGNVVVWKCFDTVNTDKTPDNPNDCIPCVYDLMVQSVNSDIISNFMNVVNNGILKLLAPLTLSTVNEKTLKYTKEQYKLPYIHTKLMIDEIVNLKYQTTGEKKKLTIVPINKKIPKDRYSSTAYMSWYIMTFEDNAKNEAEDDESWILDWAMIY